MRFAQRHKLRSKLESTRRILLRLLHALTFVSGVTVLCCAATAQTDPGGRGTLNAHDFTWPRSFQQTVHLPNPELRPPQGRITAVRALPPDAPIIERPGQTEDVLPGNVVAEEFVPWWAELVTRPRRPAEQSELVTLEVLVARALQQSPQVMAMSRGPLIEQTRIIESQAAFDLHVFMETAFDRASDPVGNELTTGGPPRFREEDWNYTAGARRKLTSGGTLEASQRIGYQHNNSEFFVPSEQGNSRLVLSFTQPLLRGAGKSVNAAPTVLAELSAAAAWDRYSARLQDYLVQITRAHWTLYLERAAWVQKQRLYEQARAILVELEERRKIDSSPSQIIRTRAAVAARYSELARAERNVKNAEVRLRMLVGDPAPSGGAAGELVPIDQPCPETVSIQLDQVRRTALQRRPEMNEAMKQVEASTRRVDVARKDRLPSLDLILETYVAGLEGRGDIASAMGNQFAVGEPGYTAGLRFEVPLNRRAASAQLHRCELQLQEATSEMHTVALQVLSEVDLAAGEVETSRQEMLGKYYSMCAAQEEVQFLFERWHRLAGEDRSAAQFLDDLLDAQVRLALEQYSYSQAQVGHMMALVELKRTTGTLLQHADIVLPRGACEPQRDLQHEQVLPTTSSHVSPAGDTWEDVDVEPRQ